MQNILLGDFMEPKTRYRIMVFSVCVILLMFGIVIGFNIENKDNNNYSEEVINKNNELDEVSIYTDSKSGKKYDIELVYEDHYTLCNHNITNTETVYATTLNSLKKQEIEKQKKEDKEYNIKEENNYRLVFYREVNQNCPNHFKVKMEEGVVVIYNIISETVETVYKKIDISQDLIRPEMLEELNTGMVVNSKEELNLIIEDLES